MLSGPESGIEPGPLNFRVIEELTEQSSRTQMQDVQKNVVSYFLQQIRNNPNQYSCQCHAVKAFLPFLQGVPARKHRTT